MNGGAGMSEAGAGRQSGMVLVEMLAALSIVAVMATLMLGYLGQLRVVGRLGEEVAAATELRAAVDHVQRTIQAARAAPLGGEETSARMVFEGGPHGMRFVAVTRRSDGALGFGEVRFAAASGRGQALEQSQWPRRAGATTPVARETVLDGLSAVSFAYADSSGDFRPSWRGTTLPRAVRVRLERAVGGKVVAAQAVARLR